MKIPEELLPVVEWWEQNGKQAMVVAAVAAVAGLVYWSWDARRMRALDAADDALSVAVNTALQTQIDAKSAAAVQSIEDLKAAVAASADQKCAPALKLMLAAATFARKEAGDVEGALEIYDGMIASGETPSVYAEIPVVGRAQCLEALGRFDEARKAFDDFAASNTNSYLRLTAQLGSARCLAQSGDRDGAVKALEELKKDAGVDAGAVEFTLSLVKRWVPADKRIPAPAKPAVEEKKPEAVAPEAAPAADAVPAAAEVKPAEAAPVKPAEKPAEAQ